MRRLLVLAGTGVMAYGGWLLWGLRRDWPSLAAWLLGGPVLHDLLVAPAVGATGLLLARLLCASRARAAVAAGLAVTGTLLLIAVPLTWRPAAAPPNPGLQDRDYVVGLGVFLAAVWLAVAAVAVRPRRRGHGSPSAVNDSPPVS